MTRSEVAKLIAMLKVHADHQANDATLVEVWYVALEDMPVEAMRVAYKWWIKNKKWFPKPAELIDIAHAKVFGIPPADEARAQIERNLRENYPGHAVTYKPDPLVLEAYRAVGGRPAFTSTQSHRETESLWQRFAFVYAELRTERLDSIDYGAEYAQLASGETVRAIGAGAA